MRKTLAALLVVVATATSFVSTASAAPEPDDVSVMATTLRNCDGRLEDFRWGSDRTLQHRWQTSAGGSWTGWASLGGTLIYDIDASRNADCRLEAFGVGTNHEMFHIWQTSAGGGWSGWASLGGYLTGRPYSKRLSDNRLEVCAWGPDGIYHCKAQSRPSGGDWTGWY